MKWMILMMILMRVYKESRAIPIINVYIYTSIYIYMIIYMITITTTIWYETWFEKIKPYMSLT